MQRKLFIFLAALALLAMVAAGAAWADTPETTGHFDLPVQITDGATTAAGFVRVYDTAYREPELYLPLRFCLERQGVAVEYDAATRTARAGGYVFVPVTPSADRYVGILKNTAGGYDVVLRPGNEIIATVRDADHFIVTVEKDGMFYATSSALSKVANIANFILSVDSPSSISYGIWPPMKGPISSPFGPRLNPLGGGDSEFHNGIDIAADLGKPVQAVAGGVAKVGYDPEGWGNFVIVRNGAVEYHYYHLAEAAVSTGDRVEAGQVIGYVGSTGASTGPHLHFAVKTAVDPLLFLMR